MKKKLLLVCLLIFTGLLFSAASAECPKPDLLSLNETKCGLGKWYYQGKCIKPTDFSGQELLKFIDWAMSNNKECVDGWCCPTDRDYESCGYYEGGKRGDCLISNGCFVYGE